jgi:RimJ/RimL family protein N-acetyltransferase
MQHLNPLHQPIGFPVENFTPPQTPHFQKLIGNYITLESLTPAHLSSLYQAFLLNHNGSNWTYMAYGPFANEKDFFEWAQASCFGPDPKFYALLADQKPAGLASYLRIDPKIGCIEIGHIHLSPLLQRTRKGTEALILMIEWAFENGYRRVEWKCDALNAPSRHAAQRLGLSYEGVFRQATIYKSRNRDTAWYAATSQDWPALKKAYQTWRLPTNFDTDEREIHKLSELTISLLAKQG